MTTRQWISAYSDPRIQRATLTLRRSDNDHAKYRLQPLRAVYKNSGSCYRSSTNATQRRYRNAPNRNPPTGQGQQPNVVRRPPRPGPPPPSPGETPSSELTHGTASRRPQTGKTAEERQYANGPGSATTDRCPSPHAHTSVSSIQRLQTDTAQMLSFISIGHYCEPLRADVHARTLAPTLLTDRT